MSNTKFVEQLMELSRNACLWIIDAALKRGSDRRERSNRDILRLWKDKLTEFVGVNSPNIGFSFIGTHPCCVALWWKDFCLVVTWLCEYGTDLRQRKKDQGYRWRRLPLKLGGRARETCWSSYLSSESVGWYQDRRMRHFSKEVQTCLFAAHC